MFLPIQEQRLQLERRTQIFEGIVKRAKNVVNMQIYDVPVRGEIGGKLTVSCWRVGNYFN